MAEPISRIGVNRIDGGVAVIEVDGEHDLSNAPRFREVVDGLLESGSAVVVDLSATTFVDSSILATLLDAGRRTQARGAGFAVNMPDDADPAIRRVIDVTGLDTALPFHRGLADAIDAARPGVHA